MSRVGRTPWTRCLFEESSGGRPRKARQGPSQDRPGDLSPDSNVGQDGILRRIGNPPGVGSRIT